MYMMNRGAAWEVHNRVQSARTVLECSSTAGVAQRHWPQAC